MTGYGKSEVTINDSTVVIEIKSLTKHLDVSVKMPAVYKHEELAVRKLLAKKLFRGKVEVCVFVDLTKFPEYIINSSVIKNYYKQILELNKDLNISKNITLYQH